MHCTHPAKYLRAYIRLPSFPVSYPPDNALHEQNELSWTWPLSSHFNVNRSTELWSARPSFPMIGDRNANPTLQSLLSHGLMGKATDCKFGRYIHRVHPNKAHEKLGRKGSVGVSRDCSNFLSTPYYLRNSGTGRATNFKLCADIHRIIGNKSPLKISAIVAVGVLKDSRKFSGHPYIARIARSSLQ